MEKFTKFEAIVAPLDRANVDTDLIIPKQFLKSIKRSGFGPNLFDELRYLDEGQPGQDCKNSGHRLLRLMTVVPRTSRIRIAGRCAGRRCANPTARWPAAASR